MSNKIIPVRWVLSILVLWLAIVEPLAFYGYGEDRDAWDVARCATTLYATGHYIPSRAMGFPLFEFAATPLVVWGGWLLSNQLAVLAGAAIIFALCRLANLGELKHPKIIIPTIAFLPIVVNSASSTMDFIPALAILWWGYVAYCERKHYLAAVLIGLACGFRISSGMLLLPVIVGAYVQKESPTKLGKVCLLCIATAVLAYSPVLVTYGINRLAGYAHGMQAGATWGAPAASGISRLLSMGHWALTFFGVLQTITFFGVIGWAATRKEYRRDWILLLGERRHATFHGILLVLVGICFWILPDKSEYLFPLLISITFLIDRLPAKALVVACCIILLSYHVIDINTVGGESGRRKLTFSPRPGYTWHQFNARRWALDLRQAATDYHAPVPTILMCDPSYIYSANPAWEKDESTGFYKQINGNLYVKHKIFDKDKLRKLHEQGFRLLVWNGSKSEYMRMPDADWKPYVEIIPSLDEFFGRPLRGEPIQ